MRGILRALGYALIGFGVAGVLLGALEPRGPHCPTEDSCVADYRDGAWHITEVTP